MTKILKDTGYIETSTDILTKLSSDGDNPFSDDLARIFQWITFTFLCQIVSIFGIGSNIVNMICFVKQGFKDPVNVSFLGLAVVDTCCLITVVWSNLCLNPSVLAADLPFEPIEFQYLTTAIPHVTYTSISSWITALITMGRCLCIIAPIKVRNIVTSRRVGILVVCVFVVLLLDMVPFYLANGLTWKFDPDRNKTLIAMVVEGNNESVNKISYVVNNICIPLGAFTIIIIATISLVTQLIRKLN